MHPTAADTAASQLAAVGPSVEFGGSTKPKKRPF